MKVLIFTDSHADIESILHVFEKTSEVDLVIFLGDLTYFEEGIETIDLIGTFPKKVIMLHGNHERKELMQMVCEDYDNLQFSHKEIIPIGDYDFVTYGGGGFSHIDEEFEDFTKEIKKKIRDPKKTILLFHAPPLNTKLDIPFENHHSGTLSFRNFIEEVQPLASFSGHVHEGEGLFDFIDDTLIHNPGPLGTIINLDAIYEKRKKGTLKNSF